ncbi:BRE1 E3 ubiquitin ligase-domain-containing protein [Russula earlei]|uniref:BRE1 E3 ubiquitin ligase-domain-containing protein n=1 Tax=Russula earlei TaxID=71964 RepID=A0ACC0UHN3_9AGAM|nr:BRE1 E3 ubiquitin ligase-domain-containing protein [Russula earlei]
MQEVHSRKRPHISDSEPLPSKKRAVSVNGTTLLVNGNVHPTAEEEEEPRDQDCLEQFRKEAIFRRMRHYSRENQRSQARISELERLKNSYEASLAVMGACWTQLVDTIRAHVKSDLSPPSDDDVEDLFSLSKRISSEDSPALAAAFEEKARSTHKLVAAFVQLNGANPLKDEIHRQYQRSQTECTALRSELELTRTNLKDCLAQRDQFHSDLAAAEMRLDRLQSRTVQAIHGRSQTPPKETDEKNDEVVVEEEGTKEEERKESSPAPTSALAPIMPTLSELQEWQDIAKAREAKIRELESNIESLRHDNRMLTQSVPSNDAISGTEIYKALIERISHLEYILKEKESQVNSSASEDPKTPSPSESNDEELREKERRAAEEKRIQEGSRLRKQREQLTAELNEVKAQLIKRQSLEEMKTLVSSFNNRVEVYQSEVSRLKLLLAAKAGDAELVNFVREERSRDMVELRKALIASEDRVSDLEKQLAALSELHPDISQYIRAEAESQQQLVAANKLIAQFHSTFGDSSQLPPDVRHLVEQLRLREEEVKALRLQDAQHADAEVALYDEIGKLSAAWESLQVQVSSKVFDLAAAEERIMKANLDKAKADNKFFAAMREKEAVENEHKHLARTNEKLLKHVSNLTDVDKANTNRLAVMDQSVSAANAKADAFKNRISSLEMELFRARVSRVELETEVSHYRRVIDDGKKPFAELSTELRKTQEALSVANLTLERHRKAGENKPIPLSHKEVQLQKEVDKCMSILKCSTCKQNMRSTVLTKCLHTFCKSCIDMRISTRQRKCPACNLGFAQSEVQQLYFQ